MSKDTSGRAFPWCGDLNECPTIQLGLTKREYFAGLAMQGFAANPEATWRGGIPAMANAAFEWADAMIAEGNK